jgi:hypothetical protein
MVTLLASTSVIALGLFILMLLPTTGDHLNSHLSNRGAISSFEPTKQTEVDNHLQPAGSPKVIKSVAFFAWWWTEEQLRVGIDLKNPPKKSYRKIDLWKDGANAGVTYPEKLDIVCEISNPQHHRVTYSVEVTYDLIVAPIDYPCWADLARITEEVSWSGKVKVGKNYPRRLGPGQTTPLVVKGLNLRNLLKYLSGDRESGYLWIWKLRAEASAKPIRESVERAQVVMSLIPSTMNCGK